MGRIAGVTAEETRERLLETAAAVFARLGYEKASIAEISSEAGLSSGAIYAHYSSKAELFVATLRTHAVRALRGRTRDTSVTAVGARVETEYERTTRRRTSPRRLNS